MKWYHTVGMIVGFAVIQFMLMSIAYNFGSIHATISCIDQSLDRIGKNLDKANKTLGQ